MLPLCDAMPWRTRPVAVIAIGVVQAAAFVVAHGAGAVSLAGGTSGLHSGFGPAGWSWPWAAAVGVLLHPDVVSLVANLTAWWIFGPTVEDRLGHSRFVGLWVAGGLVGTAAQFAAAPGSAALLPGSSAGVAAVVAANLALHPRGRVLAASPVVIGVELVDLPAWSYACAWGAVLLAAAASISLMGLVAAMLAGLVTGAAGARALRRRERMTVEWWDTLAARRH